MVSAVATNDESPRHFPRWLAATLLIVAIVLAYWNSWHAPFLFDDTGAVLNNQTIRRLGSLATLNPPADGSTTTARPLVNFSFALNFALSGEKVWSYHALNTAIHLLAALALMGIVRRTLSGPVLNTAFGSAAQSLAFLIALVWALHPLQTESVVCVAQRTESLCGLFYLLTLYAFVRAIQATAASTTRLWFGASIGACLAGMATKEVMVTAPVVIWLYDRSFVAGNFSVALKKRWKFYSALAATWLLLAWLVMRGGGGRGVAAGFGRGISWWNYLLQQCDAILLYLKLSFWPHPLVLDYGTPVAHSLTEVWWQGLIVVALLMTTFWALLRKPIAGFAGAWFFIILSPSSSVVPLVTQTMAEHRMYLPLAGVVSLIILAAYRRGGCRVIPSFAAVALVFGFLTVARNHEYRDTVVIWTDTVAKYPLNARAHNNLAWTLQQNGQSAEANVHFARAVELQPAYVSARYNWGAALLDQGKAAEAIAQFEAAVRLEPHHADARVNLGNALMQIQRTDDAILQYEAALSIKPDADVHYNLGVSLIDAGRLDEAVLHLQTALQMNSQLPEAHYQLARIAEKNGRLPQAEAEYLETLQLSPDHVAAHRNLGLLLASGDHLDEAAEHFAAVIRLDLSNANALANLGNVRLLQGQAKEAVKLYEEALRLRPDDTNLRESLRQAQETLR